MRDLKNLKLIRKCQFENWQDSKLKRQYKKNKKVIGQEHPQNDLSLWGQLQISKFPAPFRLLASPLSCWSGNFWSSDSAYFPDINVIPKNIPQRRLRWLLQPSGIWALLATALQVNLEACCSVVYTFTHDFWSGSVPEAALWMAFWFCPYPACWLPVQTDYGSFSFCFEGLIWTQLLFPAVKRPWGHGSSTVNPGFVKNNRLHILQTSLIPMCPRWRSCPTPRELSSIPCPAVLWQFSVTHQPQLDSNIPGTRMLFPVRRLAAVCHCDIPNIYSSLMGSILTP